MINIKQTAHHLNIRLKRIHDNRVKQFLAIKRDTISELGKGDASGMDDVEGRRTPASKKSKSRHGGYEPGPRIQTGGGRRLSQRAKT